MKIESWIFSGYNVKNTLLGGDGGAENAGLENARLENDGLKSRAGKCRTGIWRTKERGWKMQDWEVQDKMIVKPRTSKNVGNVGLHA